MADDNGQSQTNGPGAASPTPGVPSASERATKQRAGTRPPAKHEASDTTVPGGRYVVGNRVVDSEGKTIETLEDDSDE